MAFTLDSGCDVDMTGGRSREVAAKTRAGAKILLGVVAALSITSIAFHLRFNLASATSLHLLLVTAIALRWGFLEASAVSLVSVACLDYFFTEPLFQLYMSDPHDWVALVTFESVALMVSRLSNQVNRHAKESEAHGASLQKLYELSQSILLLDRQKPIEQQLASLIGDTFHVQGVALWNAYDLRLAMHGICDVNEDEIRSTYFTERNEDNPLTHSSRRVLRSGTRAIGALVLCGHSLEGSSINAAASLSAVAIERARSFSAESTAEAGRQSERLRSAMLDGLAHAFKTPLTTIKSCSSGLIEMDRMDGTEKRLVVLIDQEVTRLSDLTTRLMRTARVDNATLTPKRERLHLESLLEETIADCGQLLSGHPIAIHLGAQVKTIFADKQLLKMALTQLLDNAAKYSSPGSSITIEGLQGPAEILISVRNEGSFIPPEEREKIFERFYRSPGSNRKAPGTGIGLSVVKQVTESHLGRAWVHSDPETGTTFFISVPRTTNFEQ
jgi:two-component system, OmpR family, sensor histidine kinase KdpD